MEQVVKGIFTYLNFDGNCREAMQFYAKCLGAELQLSPFSDMPGNTAPEAKDRIVHARLAKGSSLLLASDTQPGMPFQQGSNFSVSVQCESVQEIDTFFAAFSAKGAVAMPLQDMFWGARFGMLTDQFGIRWMFNFEHPKQA
ncbi:MAG TPA: VOC family protein [Bryobacteraceae bacterium]|jgi:PhnB protein|nr:VOC family protein [Bryobacteraceae bacterium]